MKARYTKTEEKLHEARPVLSRARKDTLWARVRASMNGTKQETQPSRRPTVSRSIPSPYGAFLHTRVGVMVTLLVVFVVSTSGVALASEPARPGDLLFPIDRAIEDVRLSLTRSKASRDAVLRDMSDERLLELRSIIEEEMVKRNVSDSTSNSGTTTVRALQIEVDVFTDITVVKVELNDETTYFTMLGKAEDEVVRALRERFPFLSDEQIVRALNLEYEDRASRPQDRGEIALPDDGRARVEEALTLILPLLREGSDTDMVMRMLDDEVRGLDIEIDDDKFRIREGKNRYEWKDENSDDYDDGEGDDESDDEKRIEIRENGERIRIEEKDGEVRVRIDDDHSGSDDSPSQGQDDSDDRGDRDNDDDSSGRSSDDADDTDEEDTDSSGKGRGKEESEDDVEEDQDEDSDSSGKGGGDDEDADEDDEEEIEDER